MKQNIKKLTVLLLVIQLYIVLILEWDVDSNVIYATNRIIDTPTFSLHGRIIPLTVINPVTDEYILSGTWNINVKQGKVLNFDADMQVELYDGSKPHSHQFLNFRQLSYEPISLSADKSGGVRGIMDLGLNNTVVHRDVDTSITIDRGVLISVTPNITDLGIKPTVHAFSEPK